MNCNKLADKAKEIEQAVFIPNEFSVYDWCREIGKIRCMDVTYAKDGSVAGYVVFFNNKTTLNTAIHYLYSKDEDIELSKEACEFINIELDFEPEFSSFRARLRY